MIKGLWLSMGLAEPPGSWEKMGGGGEDKVENALG